MADMASPESASLLHALFTQSLDSIFVCDISGKLLLANPVACRVLGYSLDEMMTMHLGDFDEAIINHGGNAPKQLLVLENMDEFETVYVKKNHDTVPVRIRVNAIHFNKKDCRLVVVRDITRLKFQEEELRHANKMNAIGQLAGGIAHDFNNSLGGIMGYAELAIEDAEEGSVQHSNLEKLIQAAERAKKLVAQILTFSRKSSTKRDVVQLVPLMKDVIQFLSVSIPSSVVIEAFISNATFPILGDSGKVHELIINLATNAVHAMREEGVLRITLEQVHSELPLAGVVGESPPGDYAVIQVEDTGCGIEPSLIHMIFEPFFSTKLPDEGTGMGLSVVFGIVRSHGGNIQIESTPAVGTIFRVFFPVVAISTVTAPTPYSMQGTGKVLVIDDEPLLVDIYSKLLESLGYDVISTMDVNEALDILQDHSVQLDLLLTDQTMPQMRGVELASRARKIRDGLPVILCSGYNKNVNAEIAAEHGIGTFLQKPVRKKELALAVRNALAESTRN